MICANNNLKIENDTSHCVCTQIYFVFHTVDTAFVTIIQSTKKHY